MNKGVSRDTLALTHGLSSCGLQHYSAIRDWSLITGRGGGGATKREGGHVKIYPHEKGVGQKR